VPKQRQRDTPEPAGDDIGRLYGLPHEQFVSERNELARRLRREGRSADAGRVAKLPKPALAAWGANQALRSQPAAARELRAAGKALADAQNAAVRGRGKPGELREASERHRVALARLVDAARGLLDSKGHALSSGTLERVSRTLGAASLDPSLVQQAQEARLEREHFYSGLGEDAEPAEDRPARRKRTDPTPNRTEDKGRATTARERREREMARERQAALIKAARTRLSEARKQTARAATARDAAARAAKSAEAEYRRAEERHASALEDEANAQAELDTLRRDGA
jgi:hypothetical protein